jgi:hypothetical protein
MLHQAIFVAACNAISDVLSKNIVAGQFLACMAGGLKYRLLGLAV